MAIAAPRAIQRAGLSEGIPSGSSAPMPVSRLTFSIDDTGTGTIDNSQMGIVEELGSGMRKMFKYTPLYANGKEPIIEEQDVYRIEIPYVPTLQGSNAEATQKTTLKSTLKSALKGTRKDIVRIMSESPYVTIPQIAEQLKLNVRGIAKHIKNLQNEGIIKRIGPDRGGHWEVIEESTKSTR